MLRKYAAFILVVLPFFIFAQQKKYLHFDQNWEIAVTPYFYTYTCECYTNEAGQYHGPFTCFNDETDSIVKKYHFIENKLDGAIAEFYDNGQIKLQATYLKGLPVGEWKEWDETGKLIVHRTFDESSRMLKDYFVEENPYDKAMGMSMKQEEPPIYNTPCILAKMDEEKYKCSDKALAKYYNNPPKPPSYQEKYKGQTLITKLKYELSDRGLVVDVEIVSSSGDAYLDELAEVHIMNMLPFEAAKQYGTPINYWMEADIVFAFE